MTTDLAERKHSVTAGDYVPAGTSPDGGIFLFQILDPGGFSSPAPELPARSPYTWQADEILAATLDLEDMWTSVVNQAITKLAVRGFTVSDADDSDRRTSKAQRLVVNLDGPACYREGMSKLAHDFLTCRNGCFLEVAREGTRPSSRPLALYHLDAHRCRRTGSLEYPVVYWDSQGRWHALRAADVLVFADMPSPRAALYGTGRPAAERAFKTIAKLAAVETYFREKITGARALKLVFISGVGKKKLEQVKETSDAEMARRGFVSYKGAVVVPSDGDNPITIAEVDLAGVPDGFSVEVERKDAYLRYANALGIPVQDVQPLSGQGLGTGAQTIILDEAAEGRGIVYFTKTLEDRLNWLVMPKATTFTFNTNDLRDQKAKAEVQKTQADTILALRGTAQAPGIITADQALNMATDQGIVPKEFLPADMTAGAVVTDSGEGSKPVEGEAPRALIPAEKSYTYRSHWPAVINAAVRVGMLTEAQADQLTGGRAGT